MLKPLKERFMSKSCNELAVTEKIVNANFQHPFTCLVAGPSGSGKTTFVKDLLLSNLMQPPFQHITIYIGTRKSENALFQKLEEYFPQSMFELIEISELYGGDQNEFEKHFAKDFIRGVEMKGPGGCVVFDDLMSEISKAKLLSDLFSRHSSHMDLSVIHITQNIFYKGSDPQEHRTLYTNAHFLVLFKFPLDNTIFSIIGKRLTAGGGTSRYRTIMNVLNTAVDMYRYVIISGGFKRDQCLKFTTDIFNREPFPFQRVLTPLTS